MNFSSVSQPTFNQIIVHWATCRPRVFSIHVLIHAHCWNGRGFGCVSTCFPMVFRSLPLLSHHVYFWLQMCGQLIAWSFAWSSAQPWGSAPDLVSALMGEQASWVFSWCACACASVSTQFAYIFSYCVHTVKTSLLSAILNINLNAEVPPVIWSRICGLGGTLVVVVVVGHQVSWAKAATTVTTRF